MQNDDALKWVGYPGGAEILTGIGMEAAQLVKNQKFPQRPASIRSAFAVAEIMVFAGLAAWRRGGRQAGVFAGGIGQEFFPAQVAGVMLSLIHI